MLKSSVDILGENNARRLLKSVQNHEISINNISINMPDYFINTFFINIQYNTKFIYIVGDTNSITLAMNSYLPTLSNENHISNRC